MNQTYAELQAKMAEMEKQFKAELAEMAKRVEQARKAEHAGALEQIKAIMQSHGISSADLGAGTTKKTKAPGSVAVKYRGPNGEEWTGRGRAPNWIAGIQDREQFKV